MTTPMKIDQMTVTVYESNEALGAAAAGDFAALVRQAVAESGEVGVIFATGNSQLSFVRALHDVPDIPWDKVVAFHMDEYLGLSAKHPASFRRLIEQNIGDGFHPRATHTIRGDAPDVQAELKRYTDLLEQHLPAICVLGIGENGHLAFNDPPADFDTTAKIHIVNLDNACRLQQVGEGHFASLDDVPTQAITLTVPALLQPAHVLAIVPEARKAKAVQAALTEPVTEDCPASILRTREHVRLYLDRDSAALV